MVVSIQKREEILRKYDSKLAKDFVSGLFGRKPKHVVINIHLIFIPAVLEIQKIK